MQRNRGLTGIRNCCPTLNLIYFSPIFLNLFLMYLTDKSPTLQLDFSYYSYEYEADPYTSEGDAFELTTASGTEAQDNGRYPGAAVNTGK